MSLSKYHKVSKHLKQDEHILLRPNMYIGSIANESLTQYFFDKKEEIKYTPGLLKLVYEIIDNSVDIAIKTKFKHGTNIKVEIDSNTCFVSDDGTGIPVQKVQDSNGNEVWNPVMSWTYTMAGTNFDETEDRVSMGMNGVGSTVVSIFSKKFIGTTCDGENKLVVTTIDNNKVDSVKVTPAKKNGTSVYFEPDFDRFEANEFDDQIIKLIKDRIHKIVATYPELKFTFNGEKITYKKTQDIFKLYGESYISESTKYANVGIFPSQEDELQMVSVVNGLNVINGGSHIDYIANKLVEYLRPMIKKKHKFDVMPAQIKQHLFIVGFLRDFPNMKFDSQTKERITNSQAEVAAFFEGLDFEKIATRMFKKHDDFILPIVEYQLMKQKQAENRRLAALQKKTNSVSVPKHVPPKNNRKSGGNTFFIVEGDSAKNNFLPCRDRDVHGMYPLGGKFMNVYGESFVKIANYVPAQHLMNILGLELGKKAPATLRNGYDKIYLCSDADYDGYCINTQLINFFMLWPELFERGMIYILHTPIMEIRQGKKVTNQFYSLDDYAQYTLKSNETIKYLKGLGSMSSVEYRRYLIDSPNLEQVVIDSEAKHFVDVIFGKDSKPRKEWLHSK